MPELPEVENVRLSLESKIVGQVLNVVDIYDVRVIKFNDPLDLIERLEGNRILTIERRGKFLLLSTQDINTGKEDIFIVHLGMTGALLHTPTRDYSHFPDTITNHILMEVFLGDGSMLIYSDYRRFGSLRVVTPQELETCAYSHLKTLYTMGPEPFEERAEDEFLARIRHKRYAGRVIKDVLLDQRVVAGAGNIYASECLFPSGIYPYARVEQLTDEQLRVIFRDLVNILKLSIRLGGTSIKDYVNGEGVSGSFQDELKVYDQGTCKVCGSGVEKWYVKDRSTFHCPTCQPVIQSDEG